MRNSLLFIFAVILSACKQEAGQTPASPPSWTSQSKHDTISTKTFQDWTANWANFGKAYSDTALVTYYDMPIIDLAEVLGERASGSKFYNGLEDLGSGNYIAHLILTATDIQGRDFGNYFDITQPCPPYCNPK